MRFDCMIENDYLELVILDDLQWMIMQPVAFIVSLFQDDETIVGLVVTVSRLGTIVSEYAILFHHL